MSVNPDIAHYDYPLPPELVAQYPAVPRDASRLLVLERQTGVVHHAVFRDLPQRLDWDDLLVVNDTRVFPARLVGHKAGGGRVELLLHHLPLPEANGAGTARVRATHRGRLQPGQMLHFGPDLQAEIISLPQPGVAEVRLVASGEVLQQVLGQGVMPLPPYIHRPAGAGDRESYQTLFARQTGAIACPTAGLHFTDAVLQELAQRGIATVPITLHVGLGTFQPVRHQDFTRHRMHPEYFELTPESAARLNEARSRGKRLAAVGTTSVRVLEHCLGPRGFTPQTGWCDLFIYPGYRFRAVDRLLTNFHLPRSTLLLLVSAFAGRERILAAYREAIREKYRFYSYGDAMLII
jgi:S-adenosylmethionine:tRNA ribosyltransferase-isomerase